jgi:hypothetical protein
MAKGRGKPLFPPWPLTNLDFKRGGGLPIAPTFSFLFHQNNNSVEYEPFAGERRGSAAVPFRPHAVDFI